MAQWGNKNEQNNSPNWVAVSLGQGSGKAAQAANNITLFNNTSAGVFKPNQTVGDFAASDAAMANTSGERNAVTHDGWVLRTEGHGPVVSISATGGTNIANGETIKISSTTAGYVNAYIVLTANATGNVASAAVGVGGSFANSNTFTYTKTLELHAQQTATALNANSTGAAVANNTVPVYVTIGNATSWANGSTFANGKSAVGVLFGNATGYFSNTQSQTASFAANSTYSNLTVGLFAPDQVNSALTISFAVANGSAVTVTAAAGGVIPSSNTGAILSAPVLGGRAGRVNYETLVAMSSIVANTGSNTAQLPIT